MADDLWNSQTPLSNDQFRQLLETPRHQRITEAREKQKKLREEEKKHLNPSAEDDSPSHEQPVVSELKYEIPLSDRPSYRDRAKERRERKQDAWDPSMGKGFSRLASSDGSIDLNAMKIEETKFLGGDLEHTHLVKGLDYALLNKERARIQKSESESIKKQKQKQQKRSKGFQFVTPMGRAVYSSLFKSSKIDVRGFFRQGRTAFLFNMEDETVTDYRPTILRRSKTECEDGGVYIMPETDANAIRTFSQILSYIRNTGTGSQERETKTEKLQLLESAFGPLYPEEPSKKTFGMLIDETTMEANPEDDIFAEAGIDYKCDTTRKKKKKEMSKPFFPSEPSKPSISVPMEVDEKEGDDYEMLKMDKVTGKQIDPTALPDHYAECYPGFHQSYSAAVIDSDDEDFSHMDTRGKSVSRFHFETDEAWSKYKQNMESLPKAAFQYGVKMTDGRKTHSKLVEKHRKEQKLDSQLNKIEKIFKEKGHSHDVAFDTSKSSSTKETPSTQMSVLQTPKHRKRIRLDDS